MNQKNVLTYQNRTLHFGDYSINDVIENNPTPFYLYNIDLLKQNYLFFKETISEKFKGEFTVCYAVKSNGHPKFLKTLGELGSGADIVSVGEYRLAREAGVLPEKIVFSGVGKTDEEIEEVLTESKATIKSFNVESKDELDSINQIAKGLGLKAPVAFRLNPDVNAKTHSYIATGGKEHKFGLSSFEIEEILKLKHEYSNIEFRGLSIHIGSQLTELDATKKALVELIDLSKLMPELQFLDVGGGLGIPYSDEDTNLASLENYISMINETLEQFFPNKLPELVFEPGRIISATTGILVTKVVRTKNHFLITDAGMNDLIRPALYSAYHEVFTVKESSGNHTYDIVGPVCETGDFFAKNRKLGEVKKGEYLVIGNAGAYGRVMASTYNARPLTKEVFLG